MKNAIKMYLEEAAKTDKALADKYSEDMLPGCYAYIREQAKKMLDGNDGGIDEDTVYQWVRHYVMDGDSEIDTPDAKVIKLERPQKNNFVPDEDIEQIKKQAADEAVKAYKAELKAKAEAEAEAKKAEKAKAFVPAPNQLDLFGEAV